MAAVGIGGLIVDGRVYVDLAALVAELRTRAAWHVGQAQALGEPLSERQFVDATVHYGMAESLRCRADALDMQGMLFRTTHAGCHPGVPCGQGPPEPPAGREPR